MTTISANTILRSRNAAAPDHVLSTLLLRYPRCIHAEFMTHRVFSRNAASSRAIPIEKLIADVEANPFVPLFWGRNQKGMQAGSEYEGFEGYVEDPWHPKHIAKGQIVRPEAAWLLARDKAVDMARSFAKTGYHKQIVNRLLEPFSHITVVVSATEWSNFLAQRDHPDAEPHIAMLAREIRKCLDDESTIQTLQPGKWHLPFVSEDRGHMNNVALSVARCASTSYKTVDGFDMTLERAVALHDKLVGAAPIHASPCEHVAQADSFSLTHLGSSNRSWDHVREHKNFVGFRQYRAMLPGECQ